jgi:hypothetical protein
VKGITGVKHLELNLVSIKGRCDAGAWPRARTLPFTHRRSRACGSGPRRSTVRDGLSRRPASCPTPLQARAPWRPGTGGPA